MELRIFSSKYNVNLKHFCFLVLSEEPVSNLDLGIMIYYM